MKSRRSILSHQSQTEEATVSPLASPISIPNSIHLPRSSSTDIEQYPLPLPPVFRVDSTTTFETTNSNSNNMVKNMQTIPSSHSQTPTTPTTVTTTTVKRPRQSISSLEKLESNHMGILEGTLQEIKKTSSNGSQGRRRGKRNLKSPTEWSVNSSIPENGEDLSDLRHELDRAESVYSRRTADATFGDESSEEEVMVGSFRPIPSFEDYKGDDPADQLTNHVPSPMRINTATGITTIQTSLPNTPSTNTTTPGSQSPVGFMYPQAQNSSSLLSFHMETVSEEKITGATGPTATITPSKTKQPEDESTQETSPESNAVPHEVFVPKGSSASTSGMRTVLSQTTFDADMPPPSTPNQRDRLSVAPTTPVNARGWATVAEVSKSYTAPQFTRRHSSFSLMARSPASFLKSAQSPVHELVKKQERKRMHLKATIDSVRSKNYTVDSRLLQALTEKENLKREKEAEKIAHKEAVTSLENKIKFLQQQHQLQSEQQEGVHGLTKNHNKFLKEQLDQLQEEYERIQKQHKKELERLAEKPEALYEQIKRLEKVKKLLKEKHEQELTSKQMEYESLETKLKNFQVHHRRHEKSLQEQLEDEHQKIKKLQDRVVELETVELTIANQKILHLQDQVENARQERQELASQHRAALLENEKKHAELVDQHTADAQSNHKQISALTEQVSELQATISQLESLRAKELEERRVLETKLSDSLQHEQESTTLKSNLQSSYEQLNVTLQSVQQERDSLLQQQSEQAQLQEEMKLNFGTKVARLEEECTRLQSTLDQGIASQTAQITKLRAKLDLAETEWHDQQATNAKLQEQVTSLQKEREETQAAHEAALLEANNANVTLARNLLKDLAFGL